MAKRRGRQKTIEEYTLLGIEVAGYKARSESSLNYNLRGSHPRYARDEDLIYKFVTTLEITGVSTYPSERAGDTYELTLRGHESHPGEFSETLRDYQVRDEYGVPVYRKYRGDQIPVYDGPPGLATLNKRRGERIWDVWLPMAPRLVSDILSLLVHVRPLYASIHERKMGRDRWIQSLTVQTTNPADE